jgi:hypothetical protein
MPHDGVRDVILGNPDAAIELPRDVIVVDWHYDPQDSFPEPGPARGAGIPRRVREPRALDLAHVLPELRARVPQRGRVRGRREALGGDGLHRRGVGRRRRREPAREQRHGLRVRRRRFVGARRPGDGRVPAPLRRRALRRRIRGAGARRAPDRLAGIRRRGLGRPPLPPRALRCGRGRRRPWRA